MIDQIMFRLSWETEGAATSVLQKARLTLHLYRRGLGESQGQGFIHGWSCVDSEEPKVLRLEQGMLPALLQQFYLSPALMRESEKLD